MPTCGCGPKHEGALPKRVEAFAARANSPVAPPRLVAERATSAVALSVARAQAADTLAGGADHLCLRFGCGGFGGRLSTGNQLVLPGGLRPALSSDARHVLRWEIRAARWFIAHRWLAAQFLLPRSGGQRHPATQTRVLEGFRLRAVAGRMGEICRGHSQHRRGIESWTRRAKAATWGATNGKSNRPTS